MDLIRHLETSPRPPPMNISPSFRLINSLLLFTTELLVSLSFSLFICTFIVTFIAAAEPASPLLSAISPSQVSPVFPIDNEEDAAAFPSNVLTRPSRQASLHPLPMPPFPYIHIAKPWWLVVREIGFVERSDCMFLLAIYDFVMIGKAKGEVFF